MDLTACKNIEKYKVKDISSAAFYVSEFITASEEQAILAHIYAAPKPKWTQLSNRRLQNWGGLPHTRGMVAEHIPDWLAVYQDRIHALDVMGGKRPNHILVNEYLSGQGIMPHVDGSLFYPTITTISVGAHTVLKFLEPGDEEQARGAGSLLLEPRSLLVLQDSLYTHYLHCIEELHQDTLDDSILNLDLCSDRYAPGTTLPRDTRISLTIRHVPKTSTFKLNIGNKK